LITTKGFTRNPAITHLNNPGVYQTDDLQDLEGKRKISHSDSLQRTAYEEAAADLSRLTITVANPVLSTPPERGLPPSDFDTDLIALRRDLKDQMASA